MCSPTASLKWIESTEPKHQVKLSGRSASSPCQYTPPNEYNLQKGSRNEWLFGSRRLSESMTFARAL